MFDVIFRHKLPEAFSLSDWTGRGVITVPPKDREHHIHRQAALSALHTAFDRGIVAKSAGNVFAFVTDRRAPRHTNGLPIFVQSFDLSISLDEENAVR